MVFFCLTPTLSDLMTEKVKENRIDQVAIEKWIVQLGDRSFSRRETATRNLRQQGPAILPQLLTARSHSELEVQRRLDDLITPLQTARVLTPQRITLPKNRSARDYAAMIGAQSNYVLFADNLDAKEPLDLACARVTFWEALDRLCDSTGRGFTQNLNEDALRLGAQAVDSPYRSYEGIFRVSAMGFQYSRNTQFANLPKRQMLDNPVNENLVLNLQVQVEPKAPILKTGRVKLLLALDEEKRSMAPSGDAQGWFAEMGGVYYNNFNRSHSQFVSVGLVMPAKSSRQVSRIKGVIPVTILAEQKPLLVTDKLLESRGKKFKVGEGTFQIDDVTASKGTIKQYSFRITYEASGTEARPDYSRLQSLQQRLELRDSRGVKIEAHPNITQFNGPNSAQFQIVTQGSSDKNTPVPTQLVYIDWIQLEHEVAFDLKDLPCLGCPALRGLLTGK